MLFQAIPNFPKYDIDRVGNIWSRQSNKLIGGYVDKDGYRKVCLFKNKKRNYFFVHRLVAITFIKNPQNKPQVNHINGKKDDNSVENLEWCTQSENKKHAFKIGLETQVGSKNSCAKFTEKQILKIRHLYEQRGVRQVDLAKKFNTSRSRICYIVNKKQWKHI